MSLSDQVDRFLHNTRTIERTANAIAANTSKKNNNGIINVAGPFTRAVLTTPLGDLIRDIDPSELGLFSLQAPVKDPQLPSNSEITRAEFPGATPLRKPLRRENAQRPVDANPEIYVEAALRCIDRYQTIRPMPRAHSQVTALLERIHVVRKNIQALSETLKQTQYSQVPPLKSLVDDEEGRIQDLQSRIFELNKQKKSMSQQEQEFPPSKLNHTHPESQSERSLSPSLPQEDNSWDAPTPTRILHFTDNLMEEQMDIRDVTLDPDKDPISDVYVPIPPGIPDIERTKVDTTSEPLVARIWETVGDIIMPGHSFDISSNGISNKPPRAKETIAHLRSLSNASLPPTSPQRTSVTSPTPQQVLTASMLLSLLDSPPHFSMPLREIKDLLAAKASSGGNSAGMGQSATRTLYGCVAKRLIKIERGGGEQIVKFDV